MSGRILTGLSVPAVRRAAVVSYSVSEDERVKGLISGYFEGKDPDDLIADFTEAINNSREGKEDENYSFR